MPQVRRLTSTQYARVFAGLAVQPFAAALFGYLAFPLIATSRAAVMGGGRVSQSAAADGAVAVAASAGLVALLVTVIGAAPAAAWLLDRGPLALRQVLTWGASLGSLPILVLALLVGPDALSGPNVLRALAIGAAFGLWGAAVFWFTAIWRSALAANA